MGSDKLWKMITPLKLYIKSGCPWCIEAERYLDANGYQYEVMDVKRNPAGYAEMIRLSGQTYAPTLEVGGKVLADFDSEELDQFLKAENILPSFGA